MHETLVFVGTMIASILFGSHWGLTGAIASGAVGLFIAFGLSSTMGDSDSIGLVGAAMRWGAIMMAMCYSAKWIGHLVDYFGNGEKADQPAMLLGGVLGIMLCTGVQPR